MLYTDLPLYKECYKLLLQISRLIVQIPRQRKQTIGNELFKETSQLVITLFRANTEKDHRYLHLHSAKEKVELIHVLLRLMRDLHCIPLRDFAMLQIPLTTIGKQLTGWQQHTGEKGIKG